MMKIDTYRGYIRNWRALCDELGIEAKGRDAREREILVKGYEKWGEAIYEHLNGSFAFVLRDPQTDALYGLRDPFGTRSFYYYQTDDGRLLCGTSIQEVLDQGGVKKELNEDMLQLYLSLTYTAGEDTFYKGLKKLMPGHFLTWKDQKLTITKYWSPQFNPDETKSLEEWAEEIHQTVHDCIQDNIEDGEYALLTDTAELSYLSIGLETGATYYYTVAAYRTVNGERVYFSTNFSEYVGRNAYGGNIDLVVVRDGKKLEIEDYHMVPVEYPTENGGTEWKYGLNFTIEPNSFGAWLRYSWYNCLDFVRMVRIGLTDLITGHAAVTDMAGVIGIVDIINETGQSAASVSQGLENIAFMVALIAVNLAVMNLLPIPALDGGHVLTLCLSALWTRITGRVPDSRIENWIHSIGLILLMLLMVFVMYNDISRILAR